MSEWSTVELGKVADFGSGGTPSMEEPAYWGGEIPWISASSLTTTRVSVSDRNVTQAAIGNGTKIAPKGTTLLLVRGMSLHKEIRLGQVQNDVAYNQDVKALSAHPGVDPTFLFYSLAGRRTQLLNMVHSAGHGTGVLGTDELKALHVAIPLLPEQRRIAAVLGSLDDLIETNDSLAHDLAELQVAMFSDAWDGQSQVRLADVANVTMGQSPPGDTYNENAEGTPFYQGTRDFGWRFPTRRVWTTGPTRLAQEGDILVAVRAPVGRLNRATELTALGRGVGGLRAQNRQATLFQALQVDGALWDMFQGTGTVFASINQADMRKLSIPWVEDGVLEQQLAALDLAVAELDLESQSLRSARDELLPLLMSGRVRVDERLEVPA